jgi:hypothetical protein
MRIILLFVFLFTLLQTSYGQNASKNQEYCKQFESTKDVQRINATFEISTLTLAEQNSLSDYLYQNNYYIYNVIFLDDNTVNVYHIDAVKVDFIKDLLVQFNCYIDLKTVSIVQQISRQ